MKFLDDAAWQTALKLGDSKFSTGWDPSDPRDVEELADFIQKHCQLRELNAIALAASKYCGYTQGLRVKSNEATGIAKQLIDAFEAWIKE